MWWAFVPHFHVLNVSWLQSIFAILVYTPTPTPPPPPKAGWVAYWNHRVCASICPDFVWSNISASQSFATKLGMVVHHHEPECYARTLALLSHGPCVKDSYFYNPNVTISTISFKLLIPRAKLSSKKMMCHSRGHSNGSEFVIMFGQYLLNCQYLI